MSAVDFSSFIPEAFVQVPGKEPGTGFRVHGLSMEDVSKILRLHGAALNAIYLEKIVASDMAPESMNLAALGRAVLETVPEAVAGAIALAADAEDQYGSIRRLPIPVQTDALEKVLRLTFHTEDDLGNFVGAVLRGSESVQRVLNSVLNPAPKTGPSEVGSEAFAKT